MDTAPRLQRIDQLVGVCVAVRQPLAVLLESGPAFSVLLANHAAVDPGEGGIRFEDCLQIRIETDGFHRLIRFPKVAFQCDPDRGVWLASPDGFESLFSQPSIDPYAVVEIPADDAEVLEIAISVNEPAFLFDYFRKRFASLPRFYSPKPTQLITGENYANSRWDIRGDFAFL